MFRSFDAYNTFSTYVRSKKSTDRTVYHDEFLSSMLRTCIEKERIVEVKKGRAVWRAQAATSVRKVPVNEYEWEEIPTFCSQERLMPQSEFTNAQGEKCGISAGRANQEGEAVFYCAKQEQTALAETRPWRGRLVTVGLFEVMRDLQVVSFCSEGFDPFSYYYLDEDPPVRTEDTENFVLGCLDDAYRRPLTADDNPEDYYPTQIITSFLKENGFDGIAYNSAAEAGGINLALFALDSVSLQGRKLMRTESINPVFSQYQ